MYESEEFLCALALQMVYNDSVLSCTFSWDAPIFLNIKYVSSDFFL